MLPSYAKGHPPIENEAYTIWISKYQPRIPRYYLKMKRITKCLRRAGTCYISGIKCDMKNNHIDTSPKAKIQDCLQKFLLRVVAHPVVQSPDNRTHLSF